MLRTTGRLAGIALLAASLGVAGTSVSASAGSARPGPAASPPLQDLYVGAPGRNGTGAVDVRLADSGTRVLLTPPKPVPGARFGAAVLTTELDTSLSAFVLVGAPGLKVEGKAKAGGIYVFERVGKVFRYRDLLTQDHPGIPGTAQAGAEFGAAIDMPVDGEHRPVYVGVPGLDVGNAKAAGGVLDLDLTTYVGGKPISGILRTLDLPGSPRPPQPGDRLGSTISVTEAGTFWGAPGATVNGQRGAGLVVHAMPGPVAEERLQIFYQGKDGLQGAPEAGDAFGSSLANDGGGWLARLWIGVPGEDVGTVADAGMVNALQRDGSPGGDSRWKPAPGFTQNTPDDGSGKPVEGVSETGDRFGSSMCSYYWKRDGFRLLVGTPGETIRTTRAAGSVTGLLGARSQSQETVGGRVVANERFGTTLYCRGPLGADEFLIGAPPCRSNPAESADFVT